ncbi:Endonuclease/exonuclease/phosphatase [Mycena galopus ATCC 62051]|nr:Endonuclease/exonuclease/phosphatase [Mycena galopus ATCC 62051]
MESSIRALLRPSDTVKVVLDALVVPSANDTDAPDPLSPSPSLLRNRRVLAVVAHSDGPNTQEEGSVFILKAKPTSGRAFDQTDILRVFPIFGSFSITMAQVRRETWPLPLTQSSSSPGLLSLTIKQDDIEGLDPLTLCTQHVQTLRDVLAKCKRLKEIADAPPTSAAPPLTTFSWLAPYTSRRAPLPALFALPPDLRTAQKPLHTRLSAAFAGEPGDDAADVVLIRDEWIRARVRERCSRGKTSLRIRIGTFNVNGNPPSQDLSPWVGGSAFGSEKDNTSFVIKPLPDISPLSIGMGGGAKEERDPFEDTNAPTPTPTPGTTPQPTVPAPSLDEQDVSASADSESDSTPDLLVLGFQELDLSAEALIYSTSTVREDAWCAAAFAALGARAVGYEKLASKQLVGILLVVIVRKELRGCFPESEIRTAAAGTGIMGLMGNKGGTAIRLKFTPSPSTSPTDAQTGQTGIRLTTPAPTVLTFVNAHLAAFDEMVERRNADFHDLAKRLRFELGAGAGTGTEGTCGIFESDVLFWMGGDFPHLNYRLDIPDADVRTILAAEEWAESRCETLLQYDQLKSSMRANKAFDMFTEGPITHLPTYRFNAGLGKDELGYDLKRRPAWTDRVLFTSNAFAPIQQLSYTGHPQITQSDHRPVSAEFVVEVDLYDQRAAEGTADKLYRQLNGLEDAHEDTNARINLKILNAAVNLGQVSYKKTVTTQVGVRNIGKVPCVYRLVPIDPESSVHPDWLKVEPMTALLLPDCVHRQRICRSVEHGQ